jgi:hypothetical protein|tara:strand:- start:193 stop:603 length:411 start_codon:yes stop_codon:yes gene_type:complete
MLFYNWQKIYDISEGNVLEIFKIFEMVAKNLVPENRKDVLYKYKKHDFNGTSFLVHPDVLLFNAYKHTYKEIATYLAAASIRSVSEYLAHETTTLELLHVPFANHLVDNINNNSLLRIDKYNLIHFLYEEVPTEIH